MSLLLTGKSEGQLRGELPINFALEFLPRAQVASHHNSQPNKNRQVAQGRLGDDSHRPRLNCGFGAASVPECDYDLGPWYRYKERNPNLCRKLRFRSSKLLAWQSSRTSAVPDNRSA